MRTSSGFSIMELMIVISIIAAVLALSVPKIIDQTNHYGPRYAADVLYGDLQLARMRAASNNHICRVFFNLPNPNQYMIRDFDLTGAPIGPPFFKIGDLNDMRGNLSFQAASPLIVDPPPMTQLDFMPQGLIANVQPAGSNSVYVTNQANTKSVRVRVSLAGGTDIDEMNAGAAAWR